MTTREIAIRGLHDVIDQNDIVFLDFWAAWCGPCRMFAPVFEKAAGQHPDIVFGKVDTEAQRELAAAFHISSIPTLMVFREGAPMSSVKRRGRVGLVAVGRGCRRGAWRRGRRSGVELGR